MEFTEAYLEPPMVHVAISMWDTGGDTNQRADLRAEKITTKGFSLVFRTWGDSRVARIRADWMAIGQLPDDDIWDVD
ncbi:H-type lectin domain-containing protein [Gymnodinialimonas hymeniacidonis]|uniref:H-type lectin domain-containing protein n=1 Tax=Gymnodinialimonas hymeniacidonis TaxID=3126508 RepID=UPI0034C6D426